MVQRLKKKRMPLQILRTISLLHPKALEPHFSELVPCLCSLLSAGAGPTKLATERTLSRVLQVRL